MEYVNYTLNILALIAVGITFLIAFAGCIVPIIPGPLMAFVAVLIYNLCYPKQFDGWTFLMICAALTLIAQIADFLFTYLGAKKFGASWRGILGSMIGVFFGMFIPPQIVWIFLLPALLAIAFELLGSKTFAQSAKAGFGAFIGSVASTGLKLAIVLWMAIYFAIEIYR